MQIGGLVFLAGYILLLGVGTFLQKFSMQYMTAFQLNFLMSIGMVVIAVPALYLAQRSFMLPGHGLWIGVLVGLMFAAGSLLFTLALSRMPAGLAGAISISYVLVVFALSVIFLKEDITPLKVAGVGLAVIGVAILMYSRG